MNKKRDNKKTNRPRQISITLPEDVEVDELDDLVTRSDTPNRSRYLSEVISKAVRDGTVVKYAAELVSTKKKKKT